VGAARQLNRAMRQLNMPRKFLFFKRETREVRPRPSLPPGESQERGNGHGEAPPQMLKQRFVLTVMLAALGSMPVFLLAAPTTFEPVIGSALLCNDQIDPVYFKDYLIRFYKNPYKTEGEAYWFKPDPSQRLYGLELADIYVSTEGSRYAFLGVVFKEKLDIARKKMLEMKGVTYLPFSGDTVLRSAQGSFLIEYDSTKTKLYCVKHRI
jgi:hypothetical protein